MKTVNLSKESPSINELLIMARNKSLLLVADDGTTYLLEEADNFDQEAAQLGNFGNSGNVASAEIHNDVRNINTAVVANLLYQVFFKPVCLRLHTIDQDATDFSIVQPAPLEHMPGRSISSFTWIRGRKDLVSLSSCRLKFLPSADGCIFCNCRSQLIDIKRAHGVLLESKQLVDSKTLFPHRSSSGPCEFKNLKFGGTRR